MHWLLCTEDGFELFTDHNNIMLIFDATSILPDLSQSSIKKAVRWAVHLTLYNYVCFHINGTDNVWADLLGRWGRPQHSVDWYQYLCFLQAPMKTSTGLPICWCIEPS